MSDEEWNASALVGTQVGTCVLERPLGIGGMGAVYLARQTRPRRQVAVKLLRPRTTADPREWGTFLARFRREADATAALDHANIVPIYEFGEDGALAYLVMPYLPDGSLGELIARDGPLPVMLAVQYLEQTASALAYAHRHSIIHRDVKPSNLLLHPDGRLLLADFGIARPLNKADLPSPRGEDGTAEAGTDGQDGELTRVGVAMGTPEYMAPEQIRGEPISPATDIYALGMVAYAILTGHTAFAGSDTSRILTRQVNEPPRPLRTLRPDVPLELERAVLWALAKNPDDRPPSASAFARALGGRQSDSGATGGHRAVPAIYAAAAQGTATALRRPRLSASEPPPVDVPPANPDETIHDGAIDTSGSSTTPGGLPVWPGGEPPESPFGRGRGLLVGCLAAMALALALILIATNAAGWLESLAGISASVPTTTPLAHHAKPTPTATATPTPTPSPTPSPTVPANWLSAVPDSLTLGCDGSNKQAQVTLTNNGSDTVDWQAVTQENGIIGAAGGGIGIAPHDGHLDAGQSINVKVTNDSRLVAHQGTITFNTDDSNAGQAPQVSYQTQACGFGGGGG